MPKRKAAEDSTLEGDYSGEGSGGETNCFGGSSAAPYTGNPYLLTIPQDLVQRIISYFNIVPYKLREVHASFRNLRCVPATVPLSSLYLRPSSNWLSIASLFSEPEYSIAFSKDRPDVHYIQKGNKHVPADFGRPKAYDYPTIEFLSHDRNKLLSQTVGCRLPLLDKNEFCSFNVAEYTEHHVAQSITIYKMTFHLCIEKVAAYLTANKGKEYEVPAYFAPDITRRLLSRKSCTTNNLQQVVVTQEGTTEMSYVAEFPVFGLFYNVERHCFKSTQEIGVMKFPTPRGAIITIKNVLPLNVITEIAQSRATLQPPKPVLVVDPDANNVGILQAELEAKGLSVLAIKTQPQLTKASKEEITSSVVIVTSSLLKKIAKKSILITTIWERIIYSNVDEIMNDTKLADACASFQASSKWGWILEEDTRYSAKKPKTKKRKIQGEEPDIEHIVAKLLGYAPTLCGLVGKKWEQLDLHLRKFAYENMQLRVTK